MKVKQKSYLITGASGFIGANLVRKLVNQRNKVHLILRQKSHLWRIHDILNQTVVHYSNLTNLVELKKIISKSKPDIIYHLAAYGAYSYQNNFTQIVDTNLHGTWNLLQACLSYPFELFVNTGSSSEYGYKSKPMREGDRTEPNSYYAIAKCAQTNLCVYFAKQHSLPIVSLRPFSVYGPYEEPGRLIPSLLKAIYYKQSIDLVDPCVARDFIYVEDMVSAYLNINKLKKFGGSYFNIGTGEQTNLGQIVKTAVQVTGKTTDFRWKKMPNRIWDTTNWVADITLVKKQLGWRSQYSVRQGLLKTWQWFKKYKNFYD